MPRKPKTANYQALSSRPEVATPKHNQPAGQIDHALQALDTARRATATQIATGGRPAQLWTATTTP